MHMDEETYLEWNCNENVDALEPVGGGWDVELLLLVVPLVLVVLALLIALGSPTAIPEFRTSSTAVCATESI